MRSVGATINVVGTADIAPAMHTSDVVRERGHWGGDVVVAFVAMASSVPPIAIPSSPIPRRRRRRRRTTPIPSSSSSPVSRS